MTIRQGAPTTNLSAAIDPDVGQAALFAIYEISKLLASANRLEINLADTLGLMSCYLNMRHGLIVLLDQTKKPDIVVCHGWSENKGNDFSPRLPEQAIDQIITTKMPLVVENVESARLFIDSNIAKGGPNEGKPYCLLGVPIKDGDDIVGTLTVHRIHENVLHIRFDRDIRFLTMVANLVGQTLRLQKLIKGDRERLLEERASLKKSSHRGAPNIKYRGIDGILGDSPAVRAVVQKVRIVAGSRSTVMLRGESGTGKELFAAAIHNLSPRKARPFIKLNCAVLAESVLESELFGHERGAFTGAEAMRKGRFELADGGTLFLDEIGDISKAFQAKLLRVLQEGEFERVGGARPIKVDVRLICATNKNLEDAVRRGEFRSDLYYRICVVPILLPPLRERVGDIGPLANEFLNRFNAEHNTHRTLTDSAIAFLSQCKFPGNIRELENCVLRAATLAQCDSIEAADFACDEDWRATVIEGNGGETMHSPEPLLRRPASVAPAPDDGALEKIGIPLPQSWVVSDHESLAPPLGEPRLGRERILDAMELSGWVKAKAARMLGCSPRQVGYALRKYNIQVKKL